MTWRVLLTPTARKERGHLEANVRRRVDEALRGLQHEPSSQGVRKLAGSHSDWRLRLGDYRLLYEVDDEAHAVTVWRIAHRRDAYS